MKTLGYNHPLYILPFDHRGSFETGLFGWHGALMPEQIGAIAAVKQVIYEGFKAAVHAGVPKDTAGILVDEQFGSAILGDAAASGYITACPVEKSGQEEFAFEYGEDFAAHIEAFNPTFSKVLVRFNPGGDPDLNQRQVNRLKRLSEYLHSRSKSRFMFELLVPPTEAQVQPRKSKTESFDLKVRPRLMVEAIRQLQNAGVEPDVWKVEGLDFHEDCEAIVTAAQREGRENVGCIILGRGESDNQVREWLTTAAGVEGFIGFAVGRTVFWDPLKNLLAKNIPRETAVSEITCRYWEFAGVFGGRRALRDADPP